jgi:chromosome segregation ATPase
MGKGSIPHKADASAPVGRTGQLKADLSTAKQTISTLQGQIDALNGAVKAKDEEIKRLTDAAASVPAQVAQNVQIQQSRIGLPTPPTPPPGATKTGTTLLQACKAELEKIGYVRKDNEN